VCMNTEQYVMFRMDEYPFTCTSMYYVCKVLQIEIKRILYCLRRNSSNQQWVSSIFITLYNKLKGQCHEVFLMLVFYNKYLLLAPLEVLQDNFDISRIFEEILTKCYLQNGNSLVYHTPRNGNSVVYHKPWNGDIEVYLTPQNGYSGVYFTPPNKCQKAFCCIYFFLNTF